MVEDHRVGYASQMIRFAFLFLVTFSVFAADDPRYCGTPARDADGRIARSAEVLRDFKRIHPCPSTGKTYGACPGWAIDHVIPLANGGCDQIGNLQWLPNNLKSCPAICKDRWERNVYKSRA